MTNNRSLSARLWRDGLVDKLDSERAYEHESPASNQQDPPPQVPGLRRFAYADPPYPGQAHIYKGHPDYAGEVDHGALIDRLESEFPDGWALSTSTSALAAVLSLCPRVERASELRVCAWIRGTVPRPPQRVAWCWEPLIIRTRHWRQRYEGDFVRDTLTVMQPSGFLGGQITGAKPVGFCHWMFGLLGLCPHDELVDIFPGSGAVGFAWDAWRVQTRMAV